MRLVLFAANFQTFYQQTTTTESDGNVGIKVSFHHFSEPVQTVMEAMAGSTGANSENFESEQYCWFW